MNKYDYLISRVPFYFQADKFTCWWACLRMLNEYWNNNKNVKREIALDKVGFKTNSVEIDKKILKRTDGYADDMNLHRISRYNVDYLKGTLKYKKECMPFEKKLEAMQKKSGDPFLGFIPVSPEEEGNETIKERLSKVPKPDGLLESKIDEFTQKNNLIKVHEPDIELDLKLYQYLTIVLRMNGPLWTPIKRDTVKGQGHVVLIIGIINECIIYHDPELGANRSMFRKDFKNVLTEHVFFYLKTHKVTKAAKQFRGSFEI